MVRGSSSACRVYVGYVSRTDVMSANVATPADVAGLPTNVMVLVVTVGVTDSDGARATTTGTDPLYVTAPEHCEPHATWTVAEPVW